MNRYARLVLLIASVTAFYACDSDKNEEATGDNALVAYERAIEREALATYTVLYTVADGTDTYDLRRSRSNDRVRWDSVVVNDVGFAGESTLIENRFDRTCLWGASIGDDLIEVSCWAGEMSRWQELLGPMLANSEWVEFAAVSSSRQRVLGTDTDCIAFDAGPLDISGRLCISDDGVPMQIEIDHYLWGQRTAEAVAIDPPLKEHEMTRAIVPDGFNSTFRVREFRPEDVVFPSLPALEDVIDPPPSNDLTTR